MKPTPDRSAPPERPIPKGVILFVCRCGHWWGTAWHLKRVCHICRELPRRCGHDELTQKERFW